MVATPPGPPPLVVAEDTIKGQPTLLGEAIASILLGIDDVRDGVRTIQAMGMGMAVLEGGTLGEKEKHGKKQGMTRGKENTKT